MVNIDSVNGHWNSYCFCIYKEPYRHHNIYHKSYHMSPANLISRNMQRFPFYLWQVGYLLSHPDVKLMSSLVSIGRLRMDTLVINTTSSEL